MPEKAARKTVQAVQKANNAPDLVLRARRMDLVDSRVGFFNKRTTPHYRAFIDVARLQLENFTNQRTEGQMTATLDGRFMASGPTKATAHFRPEIDGPDFDIRLAIENTDLRTMNDMLRAHGKFDVVAGVFSFYSELAVKNAQIRGWVKPLFKDVQAYDPAQDRDKSTMKKLYEKVITGVAKVMKNVPRKEVATQIDISGRLDNPQTSTVQAIIKLIQNAFIKAILPGFDREVRQSGRERVAPRRKYIMASRVISSLATLAIVAAMVAPALAQSSGAHGQRPGDGLRQQHAERHARAVRHRSPARPRRPPARARLDREGEARRRAWVSRGPPRRAPAAACRPRGREHAGPRSPARA